MAEVFNIIWCDRTFRDDSTKVQRRGRTPINLVPSNKAVVLYPSLLTPEIVVGDGDIEILVALLKYAVLTREDANKHIKIYPGLEPSKVYWTASDIADEPLFQENLAEKIEVKGLTTEMSHEKILSTHRSGKFAGLIAESMVKMLKANGLTSLYSVVLSNECLKKRTKHGMALNVGINAIEPKEFQDVVLTNKVMEELHGKSMLSGGKYCFQVNASGMDLCRLNRKEPIQSYHPVFYYKTLDAPRVGFVSDVHVSPRQQLMARSKARVVEYRDEKGVDKDNGKSDPSPELGGLINNNAGNLAEILRKMGKGKYEADMVVVGGDLIDCVRSFYPKRKIARNMKVKDIWQELKIDYDGDMNYTDCVSLISVFSIILDFCRKFKKPVFVLSGNHDCYHWPYGISPRILRKGGTLSVRANEGIPADHNLTINEALLVFGETYDKVASSHMFNKMLLKWFYGVMTPFASYRLSLARHELVVLGWGDTEDVKGIVFDPLLSDGEYHASFIDQMGHLPRADRPISDPQKTLLDAVLKGAKRVVLCSHFTVVSYRDQIPSSKEVIGKIHFASGCDYGVYEWGTFETNRDWFYKKLAEGGSKIECVLSGHSHRHGLYTVEDEIKLDPTSLGSANSQYRPAKHIDISKVKWADRRLAGKAWVIVADSAGPIPRYNYNDEFFGWGSDCPAGVRVCFDAHGEASSVDVVRARVKPRAAVALDYLDMVAKKKVLEIRSPSFVSGVQVKDFIKYCPGLDVRLTNHFAKFLQIEDVVLYAWVKSGQPTQWGKVRLVRDASGKKKGSCLWSGQSKAYVDSVDLWCFEDASDVDFYFLFYDARESGNRFFLSLKVGCKGGRVPAQLAQYDFESYWTFRVKIERKRDEAGIRHFTIERHGDSEYPDYEWRRKAFPAKYA